MSTTLPPLTVEERLELADRMDDLIDEHEAGWSVPVMEGFFLALALISEPPDPSTWINEALPSPPLDAEERAALETDVLRLCDDVREFIQNEDSEWMPLYAYTESMDAAFTALGLAQCFEHFAPAMWKRFASENKKSAAVIRTMADYALEGGRVSKAQFDAVEGRFMEVVFEIMNERE